MPEKNQQALGKEMKAEYKARIMSPLMEPYNAYLVNHPVREI
jgi:hypothetical protein